MFFLATHSFHSSSEASYGSHTNTNRMLETSSHMGSKHLLTFAGPNGVAHTNLMNGMNFEGNGDDNEKMEEIVDLSQIQAELMLDVNAQEMMMTCMVLDKSLASSLPAASWAGVSGLAAWLAAHSGVSVAT